MCPNSVPGNFFTREISKNVYRNVSGMAEKYLVDRKKFVGSKNIYFDSRPEMLGI